MPITELSTVVVPVADQDAALTFYTEVLGLETLLDFTYETGERWLEVVPPGAQTALNLVQSDSPGIETRVIFITKDLDKDREELEAKGVRTSPNLTPGEVRHWAGAPLAGNPPMFFFTDPDGNEFLLVTGPS